LASPLTLPMGLTQCSATALPVIWSWYTGCWWVACYIWYRKEGTGRATARPGPSSHTKCNSPPINT